jgi:hypothetical protein
MNVQGCVRYRGYATLPTTFSRLGVNIGVAITINERLEKIDWYGHSRLFRRLWPGLLRAAMLEALLQRTWDSVKPRQFDAPRFMDLPSRLDQVKPRPNRPSAQTLEERWQFAACRVSRTTYLRTGTVAHTSVSF